VHGDLEGNDRDLISVPYRHLPGGTEENHEEAQSGRYPGGDSYRALPEIESRELS
jgi:hypothetical protein